MTDRLPPCPLHATCGGCPQMTHSPEDQLAEKVRFLSVAMGEAPDVVVPSPAELGYRARISLSGDAQGRLGYHRPKSHDLVTIAACAIARPEINAVLGRLPPLPGVRRAELRSDGARVVLAVDSRDDRGKPAANVATLKKALAALPIGELGLAGIAVDGHGVAGEVLLRFQIGAIEHRLSPDTFYQVNLEVNAALVAAVGAAAADAESLLDLYAGAGNLSLPLLARGKRATLIESSHAAVGDARRTIKAHGLPGEVKTGDAGRFRAGDAVFDVALLDPPRAGAGGLLTELLLTRPKRMIYVSCNPVALARDIKPARKAGYAVESLSLFDMFPQTPHMEALCVLSR